MVPDALVTGIRVTLSFCGVDGSVTTNALAWLPAITVPA